MEIVENIYMNNYEKERSWCPPQTNNEIHIHHVKRDNLLNCNVKLKMFTFFSTKCCITYEFMSHYSFLT